MTNPQFTGMETEFAPGVLRGVRAWREESPFSGQLRGITFALPWSGGENVARCHRQSLVDLFSRFGTWGTHYVGPTSVPLPHPAPHPACTCGFYAYFGDASTTMAFTPPWYTTGVIEAYGPVLIGTQGFRAAKARIVALSTSSPAVRDRYPNIPTFYDHEKMLAEFPPDNSDSIPERKS